jgi:hypothetical protein
MDWLLFVIFQSAASMPKWYGLQGLIIIIINSLLLQTHLGSNHCSLNGLAYKAAALPCDMYSRQAVP